MSKDRSFEVTGHRFYKNEYPKVDDVVMVKVDKIDNIGVYVTLLEYNNIQGFIPASELSRRRIRSIPKLVQVGKVEPSVVTRVDEEKGYVDLSKRRVAEDDIRITDRKYQEAKKVHNIAGVLANNSTMAVNEIYERIIWPLADRYESGYNAFTLSLTHPEVLADLDIDNTIRQKLIDLIKTRMAPQPKKVRADIEVTCFSIHGVDGIRDAMVAAESVGTENMPISITLIAPPLYVMTAMTLEEKVGIELLKKSLEVLDEVIRSKGGNLVIKNEPRVAHKEEDADLEGMLKKAELENQEVEGDDDEEDE